jgi:transcriptional regulator with XRE-family HTH domain
VTIEPQELGSSGAELAVLLQRLRKVAKLSGEQVAKRCNISQSKVSRIENGKVRPSLVDVEQFLRAVEAPAELVAQAMALARIANTEWQDVRSIRQRGLDRKQAELAGLEKTSTEFRYFLPSMVTGLLATP